MSRGSSSIGIGNILFWGWLAYMFFGTGTGKEEKAVKTVVDDKPSIIDQVKEHVDNLKPEVDNLISKAKKELEEDRKEAKRKVEEVIKEKDNDNGIYGNNDKYGSLEDKW
jgi:hypothetical protein